MTFANAVEMLTDGKAAKRPSWGGYVYKTVTSESGASVETYTLTFKQRGGTTFVYTYDGSEFTEPTTVLGMDAALLESMLADDWTTGSQDAFETARTGTGAW